MRVSKAIAALILLATLVPIAYVLSFMVFAVCMVGGVVVDPQKWFETMFGVHILAMVWIWGLQIFYLVFVFNLKTIPRDHKIVWAVVLFFTTVLSMPVFWYLHIWRVPPESQAQKPEANKTTRGMWLGLALALTLNGLSILVFSSVVALILWNDDFPSGQASAQTLEVRDPNSPTVVRITGTHCVILADGRRRTQFTGWPTEQVEPGAVATGMVWHSNPTWVEITLSSGERLKLTWDEDAAEKARASREPHYYLRPEFQTLPVPGK